MLAQVTDIQKFIMADSEDEFVPIFVAASAVFVAISQRICRPTSCGHRLDARRPADTTSFGTHITDARPMHHDVRPM